MNLKKLKRNMAIRHHGIPIFFVVYKPQTSGKNVIYTTMHPDVINDANLKTLMELVANRVREYYASQPELLEEALKDIMEAKNE